MVLLRICQGDPFPQLDIKRNNHPMEKTKEKGINAEAIHFMYNFNNYYIIVNLSFVKINRYATIVKHMQLNK